MTVMSSSNLMGDSVRNSRGEDLGDVDKEGLEQAPGFDKDDWPDMADRSRASSVCEFCRVTPHRA